MFNCSCIFYITVDNIADQSSHKHSTHVMRPPVQSSYPVQKPNSSKCHIPVDKQHPSSTLPSSIHPPITNSPTALPSTTHTPSIQPSRTNPPTTFPPSTLSPSAHIPNAHSPSAPIPSTLSPSAHIPSTHTPNTHSPPYNAHATSRFLTPNQKDTTPSLRCSTKRKRKFPGPAGVLPKLVSFIK